MAVEPAETAVSRSFFGQVAARETVDLAFQVPGQILEFPAIEGARLPRGALIARLDPEPFELALADARARADQASRTVQRLERLQGSAVSEVAVQDARTEESLAQIALRNAARALEQATLVAPFDALVAGRNTAVFSSVQAGMPVVRLHDMSELRITLAVPEVLFLRAGQGADIALTVRFGGANQAYAATPREFRAETSAVGQTFELTLGLAPPEGLMVLPGASARVEATVLDADPPLIVPGAAVVTGNDGAAHVMVFSPEGAAEGTVRRSPVEIAPTPDGRVRILSGLTPGQEIVASGAALLRDGATVRRFDGF